MTTLTSEQQLNTGALGGRAQRRQRQAEERLSPYIGRVEPGNQQFLLLDKNKDGMLSRRDLRKLYYKKMPLEHCASPFFQSCDRNMNKKVTLREWAACLVDRSEAWFYHFMSMKMGSHKLCPAVKGKHELLHLF
ncbi:SPARC [Nematolebias whitei]|uniref:SPARC n=1 Tax=Nematolebias whitei TaxID=451745 RepID=UPI0018996EB5|nr:SPARC [Nematolebias whitei]